MRSEPITWYFIKLYRLYAVESLKIVDNATNCEHREKAYKCVVHITTEAYKFHNVSVNVKHKQWKIKLKYDHKCWF